MTDLEYLAALIEAEHVKFVTYETCYFTDRATYAGNPDETLSGAMDAAKAILESDWFKKKLAGERLAGIAEATVGGRINGW